MILHHEFIKSSKRNKNKIAIIDKMLGSKVTYNKALIGSLVLKNKFQKIEDKYIGIMIPNSAGVMLATIGVLMAGKIPVMINYSTGAAENSLYAQKKASFKTIITSRALLKKIECPLIEGMICIEDILLNITTFNKITAALISNLPSTIIFKILPKADREDTACLLFTSGSEKDPKAVQLSHKNLGSNIVDVIEVLELTKEDIILSILPLFHVFGIQTNFWMPLILGVTVVTHANPLDYKNIPKMIKDEKCTMMAATPIFLSGYLRSAEPADFLSLKLVVAGADKTPNWLRDEYKTKHNIDILEGYGATETSPVISVNQRSNNRPGSIGLVVPHAEVKIIGIETQEVLPPGQEGKIVVKGDLVMKGYLDNEKTDEVIKDGWYDTGDIGKIDEDGFLWHCGRLKRFVKIGGEMVSLVNTESVINNSIDSSIECCVVGIEDKVKGSSLIAVLTKDVDKKTLVKELSNNLPPIAIPKKYITMETLPKMGSGKIDFREVEKIVNYDISQTNN